MAKEMPMLCGSPKGAKSVPSGARRPVSCPLCGGSFYHTLLYFIPEYHLLPRATATIPSSSTVLSLS